MGEFDRIIEFAIRTDVELYTAMPTGWRKITGSMTALNITVRQSRQSGVARATCPD